MLQGLLDQTTGIFDGLDNGRKRESSARAILTPLRPRIREYGEFSRKRAGGKGCFEKFKAICVDLPVEEQLNELLQDEEYARSSGQTAARSVYCRCCLCSGCCECSDDARWAIK